ncbi:hypothetical protein [Halococcoides cellulosivorans]|uniref:Uncharacterized protein n=1 Tax=Halococcoides cellulosivorans TaxID=1679096 RepID=A0A2R4X192_9EURY|nr:hypothetical protein [Halococcoides cellulosivorans]AWB27564.1 hypothetical protein HARCEL1_07500 [Halococcoides cellulosivorans]
MNSIRCSEGLALLAVVIVALSAVGTAAAVTIEESQGPDEAEVGTEVTIEYEITELYSDSTSWTLNGTTELENVTGWDIEMVKPSGESDTSFVEGSQSFEAEIAGDQNYERVIVSITGTVPAVEEYSYDPAQTFTAIELTSVTGQNENELYADEIHHYTAESSDARDAIDAAADAGAAGSDFQGAVSSFENANFENAQSLADSARSGAQQGQMMRNVAIGVVALLVIFALVGGIYYWRSQQDDYDRLG